MVRIGKYPILIHILKHYSNYGLKDFILATGYKKKYLLSILKILKSLEDNLKVKFLKLIVI